MTSWYVRAGVLIYLSFLFVASSAVSRAQSVSEVGSSPTEIAQTDAPLNLSVSPVTIVLESVPGATVSTQLKIRNNSTETESLSLRFGTFQADDSGGKPRLIDPESTADFLSWLSVSEDQFEVPSNSWKTIEVTFSPPKSAALSYYYTIYIQRSVQPSSPIGAAKVEGAIAILVLTTVPSPQARQELQLRSFDVTRMFSEFLPQQFTLEIENTGNVHVMPLGNVFIDGQNKKDIAVLSINPNSNAILPQSKRTFTVEWNEGFPLWDSADRNSLGWNFDTVSRFRFGKYTAHMVLVYDNGERDVPIESFVSFWIIPWRLISGVIAVLILPAVLVFILMKWRYGKSR